ncbi:alpha/beta hydrolase [Umezawaea sp. Da 62-37]|uniref:alpha/beta hydrolase n=1 Tax=Umezawaea sp. Da 62-37 TaxID=3075927 RepID=UPI0028F71B3C|nr:alpha/beta hydrolase [Umezawaea sp. Da 62-37]WNV83003.1 alpha/beta hydrolase [Umezawaea sp. Da 62-37]
MDHLTVTVDGTTIALTSHTPASSIDGLPLIITLHGGTYTSAYYDVAGGPLGSFNDVACRAGFAVLSVDRSGYGGSEPLPEEENTFARQADLLDAAIDLVLADRPESGVVLVGHSIGGMVALEIAARRPRWPLVGVSVTGIGARIPSGGASEALGGLGLSGVVDLPVEQRDAVMFGPSGSFTEQAREAAHTTYAPTPFVELVLAPRWARERLASVAGQVLVPVHNALAEHDALWDSSPEALAEFVAVFGGRATAELVPGVGHSIDHHVLGATVHLRQLAFAFQCGAGAAVRA